VISGALASLIFAHPVRAETIEDARSLSLQVTGRISQRCLLGQISDIDLGDLTVRAAERNVNVALDCNVPFSVAVRATNGAIAHNRLPGGQGPYAGRLPYAIGLSFAVRRPAADIVTQTFQGHSLLTGQSISSRGGIASDGLKLTLALGQPGGEAGLLAGTYTETIEITVAPD
jgi:spore coat protein U-like protein